MFPKHSVILDSSSNYKIEYISISIDFTIYVILLHSELIDITDGKHFNRIGASTAL